MAGTLTVTLDPTATLAASTTYTATIKGGAGGATDVAGTPLADVPAVAVSAHTGEPARRLPRTKVQSRFFMAERLRLSGCAVKARLCGGEDRSAHRLVGRPQLLLAGTVRAELPPAGIRVAGSFSSGQHLAASWAEVAMWTTVLPAAEIDKWVDHVTTIHGVI